jgi:hypothetical protein
VELAQPLELAGRLVLDGRGDPHADSALAEPRDRADDPGEVLRPAKLVVAAGDVRVQRDLERCVEPGERLEAAVAREVREEAGIEVGDVRYVASQPWPFPVSLMLGFEADYAGGEPAPGDGELEDVRWFARAELAAAATG